MTKKGRLLMAAYDSGSVVGWATPDGWLSIGRQGQVLPILYRRRAEMAWFEPVAGGETLLVQINQPQPDDANTVRKFVVSLFEHLIAHKYRRIVVDLRGNQGGSYVLTNAIPGVIASFAFQEDSPRLFVLIGPDTASAGVVLATQLELQTDAVFVGEATGSSPNFYGTYRPQQLPNSGIYFRVSRDRHVISAPEDQRASIKPDVPAVERADQLLRGIDVALEAAMAQPLARGEAEASAWFLRWRRASQR